MAMLTRPQPRVDAVHVQSASDCAFITDYSEAIHVYRFWGLILWNSLWGEFISIPKKVIGMETTCEDKS
jgi:hypothetical protein